MTETNRVAAPPFTALSPRRQFLDAFTREHETTARVVRAFPPDQLDFRPHPRSSNAGKLIWTFVAEQELMRLALAGDLQLGRGFPQPPDDLATILDRFESDFKALVVALETAPEDAFARTVRFFSGPGQLRDYPTIEFLWFMLMDQIHHRGQLSVYLRMAGGRVPSIYGPSADEPWT